MGIARNTEEALPDLVHDADLWHARASGAYRELFRIFVRLDRTGAWEKEYGARDMAHFLSMRYGISHWKACRWINAAHALERLPQLSEALASGELSVDKVVELCRFGTPETEGSLILWARGVSTASIRHRADLHLKRSIEEVREAERSRFLNWWYTDEGRRFGLEAELPAAEGAAVKNALERIAERIPVMPGEEDRVNAEQRRADALVMLASGQVGSDDDRTAATVVVHVRVGGFGAEDGASELEDGPVIHSETANRLACSGRLAWLLEDQKGDVLRVGRLRRGPPRWMMRALKHRDRECQFPGCGARRYLQAHHIRHWEQGGPTELGNLVLVCFFHHKAGARVRVEGHAGAKRHGDLVPPQREALPAWAWASR
ncbi:MAG: DUF222 domain-containing protein, partial [Actinomycetota bacterium]|nr:DUF222 domain-containing protein [Actinomycetota bacterium]